MPRSQRPAAGDVVVLSPSSLLAQTVRVALVGSERSAVTLPWSTATDRSAARDALADWASGVLLLVLEPPTRAATHDARALVASVRLRTVAVVGGAEEGPEWGALVEAGADVVLRAASSLAEVVGVLDDLDAARARLDEESRRRLTDAWRRDEEREVALRAGLRALSPRQRTALRMLHGGASVDQVAAATGVTRSTLRRDLRAALVELGVDSTLAAIAAYDRWRSELGQEP